MALITDADLAQAREAQEALMTAEGTITAPGAGWVWDPEQGKSIPAPGAVVYAGKLRVQRGRGQGLTHTVGQQQVTTGDYVGAVPWHVTAITTGCIIHVTDSADPGLVRDLYVTDVEHSTILTARRFHAIDHQVPA